MMSLSSGPLAFALALALFLPRLYRRTLLTFSPPNRPADSPPRLVHQPPSVQALAYEPQTFECPVESEPEAEFKWFKDDQLLPSRSANLDQMGAELTFRQLDEADAGDYHCQATNYLGSVTSDRFQVTVQTSKYPAHTPLGPLSPPAGLPGGALRAGRACFSLLWGAQSLAGSPSA